MTLEHVIKINGAICPIIRPKTIRMHGRVKLVYKHKIVENHVLTGRFTSIKRR